LQRSAPQAHDGRRRDLLGQAVVNKISWQKAGGVTEPGRYMFTFGFLTVTESDLAVWKQFPNAMFTLVELPVDPAAESPSSEFHLGAFELPAGSTDV
jgi:hypothetical protein